MMPEPIPVTVLTGFLGAGKTTLLNRILSEPHGHRIAVIENEFGLEGVDHELLVRDTSEQIVEMNNGCICCTVRGDLSRILTDLAGRREAKEIAFDRVIIETTGMANPGPVTQTFFMDEDVSAHYLLDGVVTVVDSVHGHATLDAQPEAQAQVGFADRILLSKLDLVDEAMRQSLSERLVQMNPRAEILGARFGDAAIDRLLDIRGFNLNAILEIHPDFLSAETGHESPEPHDHDHDHDHEHHRDEDDERHEKERRQHEVREDREHRGGRQHGAHAHDDAIKAFVFQSDAPLDSLRLEEFLSAIVQVYGPDLLRYKGVLWLEGSDRRVVFQGVHMLMASDLGRRWEDGERRSSKMVFIGRNLPQDTIIQGLTQCLVH